MSKSKEINTQYPNIPRVYNKLYKCKVISMDVETRILFEFGMVQWWAENIVYWYEPDTQIKHFNTNIMKNKSITNESITKHSADLDEIINNIDELSTLLKSKEFITSLINDLINGKRNVIEWKLIDGSGSSEDIGLDNLKDTFGVDYSFDFKYKYDNKVIPLTIFITGNVGVKISPVRNGDWFTPSEGGEVTVDYKNMGQNLNLGLFDQDGSEIDISWLTPELKAKVTKELLRDYV